MQVCGRVVALHKGLAVIAHRCPLAQGVASKPKPPTCVDLLEFYEWRLGGESNA